MRTLCENERDEAAQTVAKPRLTVRKVLLYIWWNWKVIIYYMSLVYGQTINSEFYRQQLDSLKRLTRNGEYWPTEEVLCSVRTTSDHTRLYRLARNSGSLVREF